MFKHFIITRFNLRKDGWETTKNNEKLLTDSWLKERFDLFENYCFHSVKNQSNQNFKWFVFFDVNTPDEYVTKIQDYKDSYENFYPFFIDGMENYLPSIIEKINLNCDQDYLITSRLDNDDSLHKNYVDEVQSCFDSQDYLAIDIIDGYTLLTGEKSLLGLKKHLYNPFISLIEKKENYKTVWFREHTHWKYEKRILRVKNKLLWLTVIHSKNKENEFTGFGAVDPQTLAEFNIPLNKRVELIKSIESEKDWKITSLKNRVSSFYEYYFKDFKRFIGFYNSVN